MKDGKPELLAEALLLLEKMNANVNSICGYENPPDTERKKIDVEKYKLLEVMGNVKALLNNSRAMKSTTTTVDWAHVWECDSDENLLSRTVYIIPLCLAHNRNRTDEPIHIKDNSEAVPINS